MSLKTPRFALSMTALAAMVALSACNRQEDASTARSDTYPGTQPSSSETTPSTSTAGTSDTSSTNSSVATGTNPGDSSSPNAMVGSNPPGATGAAATAPLNSADVQFVKKAAAAGQFEVEVAKLATERATDAQVKSFAQMLVDDHTAANQKLQQIASSHNVTLPASLPDDKKKELDQLSKLSGAEFDRQFVKTVGIKDHQHDVSDFQKASKTAKNDDVKNFAESSLPTLQKHLAAAEKLPTGGKARS